MINVESFKHGFAVICNHSGIITQNLTDHNTAGVLACGSNLVDIMSPESHDNWSALLSFDHNPTAHITWKLLVVELDGEEYPCLAAALPQSEVLVIGIQGERAFVSLYEEMVGITSQLTNRMRHLYKHIAQGENTMFEEIARINNELTNTRRELQKKNQELEAINGLLEELAITDSLTGLYNRRYFNMQSPQIIARAKRNKTDISVAIFDINDFKQVNDTLGHHAGDNLLQHLAHCLKSETRQGHDTAYRLGGDEFLVVMEQCDEISSSLVLNRVHNRFLENSLGTTLALGIGTISARDLGNNLDEVLKLADQNMYLHKAQQKAQR